MEDREDASALELRSWTWSSPPTEAQLSEARQVAACYRHTFGTDPIWNAGYWCAPCSDRVRELRFNFVDAPSECPQCGRALTERWPETVLMQKFADDLGRPGTVAFTLRHGNDVVGATIALLLSPDEAASYLHLDHRLREDLLSALEAETRIALLDLTFIHPDWQGLGAGSRLHAAREARLHAASSGRTPCIVRTARTPPTRIYLKYRRSGFRIAAEYHDPMDRVLMLGHV